MTFREYWAVVFALIPESEKVNTFETDQPYFNEDEKRRINAMKARLLGRKKK